MQGRRVWTAVSDAFPEIEPLTMVSLAEFARRMGVCPNTVRAWIAAGRLLEGAHFLRAGRLIRFPWGRELVERLMRDWHPSPPPPRPRLKSRRGNLKFKA